MTRVAQGICLIFILMLGISGLTTMFMPTGFVDQVGFNPINNYAVTNVRTLGAPTLMMAIVTAIAALRKDWMLLLPASIYFALNFLARVTGAVVEGFEPVMTRGLILTAVLFILSQVAIYLFRTAKD